MRVTAVRTLLVTAPWTGDPFWAPGESFSPDGEPFARTAALVQVETDEIGELTARQRSLLYLERLRILHALVTVVLTIGLLAWAVPVVAVAVFTGVAGQFWRTLAVSRKLLARERFIPADTLNVLAAAWIQFEVHDWFSHGKGEPKNPWEIEVADDDPWPDHPMKVQRTSRW